MTPMIEYSVTMLSAFADFLGSEPIIFLLSPIILSMFAKIVLSFSH